MTEIREGVSAREKKSNTMALSENFPAGLRVMVVDDDVTCLAILQKMLQQCRYQVTICSRATQAYAILRERKEAFDLVISDVYMPDMDGFKLLELIGLELDLPVIMMSGNGDTNLVMKGITHGACDYLLKPVRIEELRNIWQHVVRKKGSLDFSKDGSSSDWDFSKVSVEVQSEDLGHKRRKQSFDLSDALLEDGNSLKKARVVWSSELHKKFVNAVNKLGIDKAVPKSILEIMKVQGLTRENVASHLQKYRQGLKKLSGIKVERLPVASFQAAENGKWGGTMQVQSTSSIPASGPKISSNSSVFGKNINQLDAETLRALVQLQATQQRSSDASDTQHLTTSRELCLKELVVGDSSQVNSSLSGLQRMSSMELNYLMQLHQGMGPLQQNDSVRGNYKDPGLANLEAGVEGHESLTFKDRAIPQLGDPGLNIPYQFTPQAALTQDIEPEQYTSDFDLSRLVEGFEVPRLQPPSCRLADTDYTQPGSFTFTDASSATGSFVPPSPQDLSSLLDEILPL